MKRSLWVALGLLLLMACTPSVPSDVIQPGDMEDILYDYHLSQAMAKVDHPGAEGEFEKTRNFLAVLKKYEVTEAEFDSSLVYYYSHIDRLKKIYSEVNERLADEAKSLGAQVGEIGRYSQYSTTGDTANIWKGVSDLMLIPKPMMNRYDFAVKVDTAFHKGDSFMFQFTTDFIWQNGMKDAVVCFMTKYEGDSIIQTVNHVSVPGLSQIRIPANNENRLKEMRGFIYLGQGNDPDDVTRKMMFVSQIQLIRFHNKSVQNEKDSTAVEKDSLQRGDHPRRELPDSVRNRTVGGLRDKTIPPSTGTPLHRVVSGAGSADAKPRR